MDRTFKPNTCKTCERDMHDYNKYPMTFCDDCIHRGHTSIVTKHFTPGTVEYWIPEPWFEYIQELEKENVRLQADVDLLEKARERKIKIPVSWINEVFEETGIFKDSPTPNKEDGD